MPPGKTGSHMRKTLLCLTFILSTFAKVHADQLKVEYYGVVSTSSDSNMIKMAQDIFLTQLKSIDYISVEDKRPDSGKTLKATPEFTTEGARIIFYAEIDETTNEDLQKTWNCKFNAMDPDDRIYHTKNETYDSYYKILSGAKSAIEDVLADFRTGSKEETQQQSAGDAANGTPVKTFEGNIDIESLSGTWYGEPFTDKIMILRGGRGFIIFKNGATMNIKITIKKADSKGNVKEIEISQVGKSNASFFPELPREIALNVASSASPITWSFTIKSGELTGTKKTLLLAENGISAKEGSLKTTWLKK